MRRYIELNNHQTVELVPNKNGGVDIIDCSVGYKVAKLKYNPETINDKVVKDIETEISWASNY